MRPQLIDATGAQALGHLAGQRLGGIAEARRTFGQHLTMHAPTREPRLRGKGVERSAGIHTARVPTPCASSDARELVGLEDAVVAEVGEQRARTGAEAEALAVG